LLTFGAWRSLVARTVRVGEVRSSNLRAPITKWYARGAAQSCGRPTSATARPFRGFVIAALTDLISHLDGLLEPAAFQDHGPNGLQVPGRDEVATVVTGVSASRALIEQAVAAGADLVLVHHGLFWGERGPVDRELAGRLKPLLDADVGLAAYHLPLDAHPQFGNNALLARALGATDVEPCAQVGVRGRLDAVAPHELVARVRDVTGREPLAFCAGPARIRSIGIVSGAGASLIADAIAAGLDAFVTGEPREPTMASAREGAIHFLAAGHHATERLGVRALGDELARGFGIVHRFIEVPNPV
jgi:dinuclear metal center YbgI/SA1388 family protein